MFDRTEKILIGLWFLCLFGLIGIISYELRQASGAELQALPVAIIRILGLG